MLMKRYHLCANDYRDEFKGDELFDHYNTFEFKLNEYETYYMDIKLQKEKTILNFRISFKKDNKGSNDVEVNIYNSTKAQYYYLKLKITDIR